MTPRLILTFGMSALVLGGTMVGVVATLFAAWTAAAEPDRLPIAAATANHGIIFPASG